MKIAIPTENGLLCSHFGHSPLFTIIDVNEKSKTIENTTTLAPPPHDKGVLPAWLADMKCSVIIAGGMGAMAVNLFEQNGITVVTGAPPIEPQEVVAQFLNNSLTSDSNPCQDPSFHSGHGNCPSHE